MKYIKSYESVWTDSFSNETNKKFKTSNKFYKLIEDKIDELVNSKIDKPLNKLNNLGDDVVGNIIYIQKYNAKGELKKEPRYGIPYEAGHSLYNHLQNETYISIITDPDVVHFTRICDMMRQKIEQDLGVRTNNTILHIFCEKMKKALNDENLYDKYKEELEGGYNKCLPDWVNRSKKANLWELK